jgi:hypothetical protein
VSLVHEFSQCRNGDIAAVARRILANRPQNGFADARLYGVATHCESGCRVSLAAQRLAGPLERGLPPLNGDGNSLQRNALGLSFSNLAFEYRDRNPYLLRSSKRRVDPLLWGLGLGVHACGAGQGHRHNCNGNPVFHHYSSTAELPDTAIHGV